MPAGRTLALFLCVLLLGCSGKTTAAGGSGGASSASATCDPGEALAGATYDVAKSKFGFGGTPTKETKGTLTRYVGPHGVVAIDDNGSAMGLLNAGAPEATLPDWSNDENALTEHLKDYFGSMGVDACQVGRSSFTYSGSGSSSSGTTTTGPTGRTAQLERAVDGVTVEDSIAYAEFKAGDLTSTETLYWPAIPAVVVSDARALRDRLADPSQLAAYRAKLPAGAQGDGMVVIRHSGSTSHGPFQAAACWSTSVGISFASQMCFDANGAAVPYLN